MFRSNQSIARLSQGGALALCVSFLFLTHQASMCSAQEILHVFVGNDALWDSGFYKFDSVGDVNGDGVPDFIYGCPGPHMHRVRSGSDWRTLARYRSTFAGGIHDAHGHGVAGIGDWDGDLVPDYAVGAPGASIQQFYEGAVRIFSGATHDLIQEISEHVMFDSLGHDVSGLGDLDGDGYPELAATCTAQQYLRIYSAPSGVLLREHYVLATEPPVAPYGDYDGDGGIDYLIGEGGYSGSPVHAGRVVLYSGKTGAALLAMEGQRAYDLAGVSISMAGDWNSDGIEDIAAGAPGTGILSGGQNCGAYVFSGADGSVLRFFDGADYSQETAGFGFSIASGKDVNGDGYPDLLVGAPAWTDESSMRFRQGAIYLISGRSGAVLWQHHGADQDNYNLGRFVYMIDDHDGDGLDQWVVSDHHYSAPGGLGDGRITIYKGAIGDVRYACPTTPNSVGAGAHLFAVGPISLRDNLLQLSVEGAPPSAFGVFVYGAPSNPTPFGDGQLCIGGALFTAGYLTADWIGAGLLPLDLFHPPFTHGPSAVHAGDSRAFQYLYRDPAAGERNASDSMVIRFVP